MTTELEITNETESSDKIPLSIVVVMYNMHREAERTLHTLSDAYQRDISALDYEVLVVDNGSKPKMTQESVQAFGANFRLLTVENATMTPVPAINLGLAEARGVSVAVMVDGARMLSPGVIYWTIKALRLFDRVAVTVPSWHLGPDVQNRSVPLGYNQKVEDDLLNSADWRSDGYRLFDCCECLDPSSVGAAWFDVLAESNFVACSTAVARQLGGYEPLFVSAGGGACNLDFFRRLIEDAGCPAVSLVGEGTFHQVHGGVTTNVRDDEHPWKAIEAEYRAIRGRPWATPAYDTILLGQLSGPAKHLLARSPNIFSNPPGNVPYRWFRNALGNLAFAFAFRVKKLGMSKS